MAGLGRGRGTDGADEQVPDDVVARARAAFARRADEGELAELLEESRIGERANGQERMLFFQHPSATVEVHLIARAEGCDVIGRVETLAPLRADPPPLRVVLEGEAVDLALVEQARQGEFTFSAVPTAIVRLSLLGLAGSPRIRTDWFRI